MSLSINSAIVGGRLTRDPESRQVGQSTVANFSLAVERRFKKGEEWIGEVSFLDIETWGTSAANVMKYLHKGSNVVVQGHLKVDVWDDQQGAKRSKVKIVALSVSFLDPKGDEAPTPKHEGTKEVASRAPQVTRGFAPGVTAIDDSEPPFEADRNDWNWA